VHGRLAFLLFPSGDEVKTKNPPPPGSGLINLVNESKPDCRAAKKQRPALRDKQQVQVLIHEAKLTLIVWRVKYFSRAQMMTRLPLRAVLA
jgi:hypothetical protein